MQTEIDLNEYEYFLKANSDPILVKMDHKSELRRRTNRSAEINCTVGVAVLFNLQFQFNECIFCIQLQLVFKRDPDIPPIVDLSMALSIKHSRVKSKE